MVSNHSEHHAKSLGKTNFRRRFSPKVLELLVGVAATDDLGEKSFQAFQFFRR